VSRVVLGAYGLHPGGGGGGVLLRALLPALAPHLAHAFVDTRFLATARALIPDVPLTAVAPLPHARVAALRALPRFAKAGDRLFCFNNAPPLGRSPAHTILCIRSPFLVPDAMPVRWSARGRLRLAFERLLLRLGRAHVDEFWVQTERMAEAFAPAAAGRPVHVRPFFDLAIPETARADSSVMREPQFFYPAAGYSYKNHALLYRAWGVLAASGVRPRLEVTLDARTHARRLAEAGMDKGAANIINLGPLAREEALARLEASDALIFPSLAESFGVPMLEAAALGRPVLAPELGYVRDVCVPAQTFDPHDARSLANAVRRFMGHPHARVAPLGTRAFVDAILA
jgi:glycosyltransferase involved in cell wall biosynthesis